MFRVRTVECRAGKKSPVNIQCQTPQDRPDPTFSNFLKFQVGRLLIRRGKIFEISNCKQVLILELLNRKIRYGLEPFTVNCNRNTYSGINRGDVLEISQDLRRQITAAVVSPFQLK